MKTYSWDRPTFGAAAQTALSIQLVDAIFTKISKNIMTLK